MIWVFLFSRHLIYIAQIFDQNDDEQDSMLALLWDAGPGCELD